MMRRLLGFLAMFGAALPLFAQGGVHTDAALQTGTGSPLASVRVCAITSTGTPCTPTAPIFSDSALTQSLGNPMSADNSGNYSFWAAPGFYLVQVSAYNQPTPYQSYLAEVPSDPFNPTFVTVTLTGPITQNTQAVTKQYVDNALVPYMRLDGTNWSGLPNNPPAVPNWTVTGNISSATGSITALNGSINAALSIGADIGAKVNAAAATCSDAAPCHVYIPPGVYSYSTPIVLPRRTQGLQVTCDRNATLTYTGVGSAVSTVAAVNSGGNAAGTILDGGCALIGTSAGTAGVHFRPGQGYVLIGWQISNFTNGDGIWVDGANSVTITRSSATANLNGLHITGNRCNGANQCTWDRPSFPGTWVNSGVSGVSGFAANAVKVEKNRLSGNSNWGILENDVVGGSNTKAFGNSFTGNVLEGNGVGAAMSGFTRSSNYENNYLEGNTDGIILGCVNGTPASVVPQTGYTAQFCGTADKSVVQKNFFNDITGSSEVMFEFADSPSADNNTVNFNAACLGDVHIISGNVSFHDNIVYGIGAYTCQDGTPGGPLHNFQVQGDSALGAEHFFGAAQVDGVLANGQLFTFNTNVPTMTGGPAIIGQMGAITIWQSSVPPTGACGGPAGMNIAFTPTEMYICSGTWRLVTHS